MVTVIRVGPVQTVEVGEPVGAVAADQDVVALAAHEVARKVGVV
ncbi:hypothetical protein [Streptomyces echinatus]